MAVRMFLIFAGCCVVFAYFVPASDKVIAFQQALAAVGVSAAIAAIVETVLLSLSGKPL